MKSDIHAMVLVMLRLPNEKKLPLMLLVFFLPLALLYYETGEAACGGHEKAWIAGGVALGVYVMVAFYLQANEGWTKVLGPFERLAKGDLTGKVDTTGLGGHFGLFLRLLDDINRSFGEIVTQVRASSHAVAHSAREIAEGNTNLSQRTEQQASTLEQTASGMEQLSSTVKQKCRQLQARVGAGAVRRCRRAQWRAAGARPWCRSWRHRPGLKTHGRDHRRHRGHRVPDQHPGAECRGRGGAGGRSRRGFAVVASEVRALAKRSADAAKEIKALIEQSVAQVFGGQPAIGGRGQGHRRNRGERAAWQQPHRRDRIRLGGTERRSGRNQHFDRATRKP